MTGQYFWLVLLLEIAVTTCSRVYVQQANSTNGTIDLTSEEPIVLSWNSTEFGAEITHVALELHVVNGSDQDPTIKFIELADNFSLYGEDIYGFFEGQRGNESYATFSVSPHVLSPCKKFIRKGKQLFGNVIGFLLCLFSSSCASYDNILRDNIPTNVHPCPNTRGQINKKLFEESNFAIDFFHPGASCCFRSKTPVPGKGSGQQCCYGADGKILIGPRSGGTSDRYSPNFSKGKHLKYDVRPWCACCYWSKEDADCAKYYTNRPGGP